MSNIFQYKNTPIHLASRYGHVQLVEKLISLGADVNAVNKVSVNNSTKWWCTTVSTQKCQSVNKFLFLKIDMQGGNNFKV